MKNFIHDFPNWSVVFTRIMTEDEREWELIKVVVSLDVMFTKDLYYTWYGEWKTIEEAQNNALAYVLNLLY